MTPTEYLSFAFSAQNTSAVVGLVLIIFVAVCTLGGIGAGWRRGLFRQILHTVSVAVSFVASFMLTRTATLQIGPEFSKTSPEEMASALLANGIIDEPTANILSNVDSAAVEAVITLLFSTLFASVIFVVCYLAVSIFVKLIYFIISRFIPKHKKLSTRIPSVLLAVCESFIAASLILTPFVAVVDICDGFTTALTEEGEGDSELCAFLESEINIHKSSPVIMGAKLVGADDIATAFATVTDGESAHDMREELYTGITIYANITELEGINWQELNAGTKASINHLISSLTDSEFYATITASLLHTVAASIEDGYIAIEAEEPFADFFAEVVGVFTGCTKDTVKNDVNTFKDVYFVLSDRGVLVAMSDSTDSLTDALVATNSKGETVINEVIGILKAGGERTKPIITTLTKLSVAVIADNLGLDENTAELYDNVKDSLNTLLSEMPDKESFDDPAEYKEEVSDQISKALADNGIELEENITDGIADYYINSGLDEYENLGDDEINDIILSYYDAYLKSLETPENPQ